jgi:hypothetical protein
MGRGFSTGGNEANEETTNELESTPISDSDFTGDSGEGTESEFSTTDGHWFTRMGRGFSTEGKEADEETTNELESTPISGSGFAKGTESEVSTTDGHWLTQMGEGFSTEGNEANEETTNELESTPISDSVLTGDNGEGTESEVSTTDGHWLTQMGDGFSTEGNEAEEGDSGSEASLLLEDENEEEDEDESLVQRERRVAASRWLLLLVCSLEPLLSIMFFIVFWF